MDTPSRNMFDTFKDQIWDQLGPLDPAWFDVLTTNASDEGRKGPKEESAKISDQDGTLKTRFKGGSVDSQLFSTPKVFRRCTVFSPDTPGDQAFSPGQEKETLPWAATTPHLFRPAEHTPVTNYFMRVHPPDDLELLDTPLKSIAASVQHITESLGARIDPDISWTSSLNTPVPSTIILSKTQESPCPVNLSEENVVIVRKLFPSLSNVSGVNVPSPNRSPEANNQQVVGCQGGKSPDSPESPLDRSNSSWKQTLPDAIHDQEIRSTVASVLEGAENVLSIFFTNSSSTLRRVKAKDRIKRRQNVSKEQGCRAPDSPTAKLVEATEEKDGQRPDADECGEAPSSPQKGSEMKADDALVAQWSPISLSDISHCALNTPRRAESAKQPESKSDADQLISTSIKTDPGFSKKKRRFIYTVQSSKPQVQTEDKTTQNVKVPPGDTVSEQELNGRQRERTSDKVQHFNPSINMLDGSAKNQKRGNPVADSLASLVPENNQDLDMSQLCRVFAQDFTQMSEVHQPGKVGEDAPRYAFSPSTCLSALRKRNKQLSTKPKPSPGETSSHQDWSSIRDKIHVHSTNGNVSAVHSSEFRSYTADAAEMTRTSPIPIRSGKDPQRQPLHGSSAGLQRPVPFSPLSKEKERELLDHMEGNLPDSKLSSSVSVQKQKSGDLACRTGVKGNDNKTDSDEQNIEMNASMPEDRTSVLPPMNISGFKTASNRGIKISAVNLKRAKDLFKEVEDQNPISEKLAEYDDINEGDCDLTTESKQSIPSDLAHSTSSEREGEGIPNPLTASQKADVTELCSLLEEANTQFEFTQFKPVKPNQRPLDGNPSMKATETELDLDFFTGIDFNDSFSCDAEKDRVTTTTSDENISILHGKRELTTGTKSAGTSSQCKRSTDASNTKRHNDVSPNSVPDELENNVGTSGQSKAEYPLEFALGFKTAGGNSLSVSKKCLSKAKALFADLEDGPLTITATADGYDSAQNNLEKPKMSHSKSSVANNTETKDKRSADDNMVENTCKDSARKSTDLDAEERIEKVFPTVTGHTTECKELENCKFGTITCSGLKNGFEMASGKGITISANAIEGANRLFGDLDAAESSNCIGPKDQKGNIVHVTGGRGLKSSSFKNVGIRASSFEQPPIVCTELENANATPSAKYAKELPQDNKQAVDSDFKKPMTVTQSVSIHIKPSSKSKLLPLPSGSALKYTGSCVNSESPNQTGFCTASGKTVSVTVDALTRAKSLLSECDAFEYEKRDIDSSVQISLPPNIVSTHRRCSTGHPGPSPSGKLSTNVGSSIIGGLSHGEGFSTASGKKVTVTDAALTKAKTLLNECDAFEDENPVISRPNGPNGVPPKQSCGFQSPNRKGVATLAAALQKAKDLLGQDSVEGQTGMRNVHANTQSNDPQKNMCAFSAASGKPVAVSAEALQKAKALFKDVSCNPEISALSSTIKENHTEHDDDDENKHYFSTAKGTKAHVSGKNLPKTKQLLNEFADSSFISVTSSTKCGGTVAGAQPYPDLTTGTGKRVPVQEIGAQEGRISVGSDCSFNTATRNDNCLSEKPQEGTFESKVDEITPLSTEYPCDRYAEKNTNIDSAALRALSVKDAMPEDCENETHQFLKAEGSSLLNLEILHLTGCTVTQQRKYAQEVVDCAKALLESKDLTGESVPMTLEKMQIQSNTDPGKAPVPSGSGPWKRPVEDTDLNHQPPLKRRLLEEFDRTVDRAGALQPAKSCSHGVMKDRRAFKYNVPLQPVITKPNRHGKNFVEPRAQNTALQLARLHPNPGDGKPSCSKAPVFIPPFQRSFRTEIVKNCQNPRDAARSPAAFVPPFKKPPVVQVGSSKPESIEDKRRRPNVLPAKISTFVSPSAKTKNPVGVTDSRAEEKIHTPVSCNVEMVKSDQNLPSDHGVEMSAAEGSDVEEKESGGQAAPDLQNFQLARDMQDMKIRKKKRQTIQPLPGSLFLAKSSGVERIPLRAAVSGWCPAQYSQKELYGYGVNQQVSDVTSETAESFRFSCRQFFKREVYTEGGGVQVADGGWLIPSDDGTVGKGEFYRALCDTPGVDPKLISEEWVHNHYRWVVWKQASMERSFPATMGGLCLTPEQILLQLKYRYDVEVDHCRRPALRKITERDDTPAKTLVLCVCGVVSWGHDPARQQIHKTPHNTGTLAAGSPLGIVWVSDGWYAIKAQLDAPLTTMLHKRRLAVGGKLIVHGAELVGSQDGCSPLEAPESLMLKVCANSSRPARWDAKLGFHRDPRPFRLPLSSLYSSGGSVGCVDVIILRSYPAQWMEKKTDGGFVFRTARAEEREARRYDNSKQKAMEALFAKIHAEFQKRDDGENKPCRSRRRRTLSRQDVANLRDGEELHEAVENDPSYLEACLSDQQLETLHSYRRSLVEKRQAELQEQCRRALEQAQEEQGSVPKRDVTPVWKLCMADSRDPLGANVYLLNLWRPSADLRALLREGGRYRVSNLSASEGKKRACGAAVQLTATKKTQFQEVQASQEWLSVHFRPRVSCDFLDFHNPEFRPLCGEVDLVGYVISTADTQSSSPVLYLVDGKQNFVKVRCFSSLAQSGLDDLVKPAVLMALSNLQLSARSSAPLPVLYAGDLSLFSTNPKELHLQEALSRLRQVAQGPGNFLEISKEKLSHFLQTDGGSSVSTPSLLSRTPGSRTLGRLNTTTSLTPRQSTGGLGSFTPFGRNPPAPSASDNTDPKTLRRRRALEFLSHIPSPPPLGPLGAGASPCVNKTFNPPRRSATPSSLVKAAATPVAPPVEDEWENDEGLAMIDTQGLHD